MSDDSDEQVQLTILIRKGTLQDILDIVEDPHEEFPMPGRAQDFFELNWDLCEQLAENAENIGMRPSHEDEEEEIGEFSEEEDGEAGATEPETV